jgi:hypothetical protein
VPAALASLHVNCDLYLQSSDVALGSNTQLGLYMRYVGTTSSSPDTGYVASGNPSTGEQAPLQVDCSTLLVTASFTGFNAPVPSSMVSIAGNITVGDNWATSKAAPDSGALFEGDVGVSIGIPLAPLHVAVSTTTHAAVLRVSQDDQTTLGLIIDNVTATDSTTNDSVSGLQAYVDDTGSGFVQVRKGTLSAPLQLQFAGGNTGIGSMSTDPLSVLHIADRAPYITLQHTGLGSTSDSGIGFRDASGTILSRLRVSADQGVEGAGVLVMSCNTGASLTETVRVDSTGRVGLNQSSPQAQLDINCGTRTHVPLSISQPDVYAPFARVSGTSTSGELTQHLVINDDNVQFADIHGFMLVNVADGNGILAGDYYMPLYKLS